MVAEKSSVTIYVGSASNVSWRFPAHAVGFYRHVKHPYKLVLKDLLERDSGIYSCFGKFSDGHIFQLVAFLDVYKNLASGNVLPYPQVVASEGDSVTLTCGSVKPVKWVGLHQYIKGSNELHLTHLKREDSGPFVCIGVTESNEIFHATTKVIVDAYVEVIPGNSSDFSVRII